MPLPPSNGPAAGQTRLSSRLTRRRKRTAAATPRGPRQTVPPSGHGAQLRALRPGLDYALVAPPRSKPDQWGEIHCPFPVTLTFGIEPANPAAALRVIELRCPCNGAAREGRPLFGDDSGNTYSHASLNGMLKAILAYLYGTAVAALFTFHSYRSGLASALHAAGVPDGMIQLICRWMCPESLHVYRRMGTREHESHTQRAASVSIDVIQDRKSVV